MARTRLTVVALTGADRPATRAFLALLDRSLRPGDNVVLSGTGHDRATRRSWRTMGQTKLIRPSARPELHEVVVLLDERTVPTGPWLPGLVAASWGRGVGAAAARTNVADGDELLIGVPYRPHEAGLHRLFVARRAEERAGQVTDAGRLCGPSLAIRRSILDDIGGLEVLDTQDPVGETAGRVARRGLRLVVAESAYLHHGGGPPPRPTRPDPGTGRSLLVSACLITKDEHANLPRCLASLDDFVDEMVVYDTGSTDDTCDIARRHGATVIEGHWDGDFARARNEALARCRGQWVLWIDADEELACEDQEEARRLLAESSSDAEGMVVMIDNLRGTKAATALTHPACRLFRRAYGEWTGRLHEQVTARAGSPQLATPLASVVRITHWGYLNAVVDGQRKGRRNLRSAFADLAGDSDLAWATRLLSLGRSHALVGQHEEALALCMSALDAGPTPGVERLARRTIVDSLLVVGRPHDALAEVGRLRAALSAPMLADTEEGRVLLALGRDEEALAAFDRVVDGLDDDGYEHRALDLGAYKATALTRLGRHGDAADVLLAGLRGTGGTDAPLGLLVECLEKAGRSAAEIPGAVPAHRAVAFLGQLVHLSPEVADRVLEDWYRVDPSRAVLATATAVGRGLSFDRQQVWSERLRGEGLGHACPLVASAADVDKPVDDRLLGAAVAAEVFADRRGRLALAALAAVLAPDDVAGARERLATVAPSVLELFDATTSNSQSHPVASAALLTSSGRSVVVIDRQVANIRTMAIAVALRQSGHDVTLVHPSPHLGTERVLSPFGIAVGGWAPGEEDGMQWLSGLGAYLAGLYALGPIDTVVLAHAAGEAAGLVRDLVPAAGLVIDLDDAPADAVPAGADLVLRASAAGGGEPAVVVPTSALAVFARRPAIPEPLRTGVCVVGDFAAMEGTELTRWTGHIAPALQRLLGPDAPVVVVGDDPRHCIAAALAGAIAVPAGDPSPWLRASRVAVVAARSGAAHWLALAAMCGTPGLVVPDDATAVAELAPAVAALANPALADVWRRFAPAAPGAAPTAPPGARVALPGPRSSDGAAGEPGVHWPTGDALGRRVADLLATSPWPPGTAIEVRRGPVPALGPAAAGRLVVELSWGFGHLPAACLGAIRDFVDEVWVATAVDRDHAVASGVEADKVHVVPTGIDVDVFAPEGPAYPLRTAKRTKVLFRGDLSERSGIDALLEAYLVGFSPGDGVCLVVCPDAAPPGTFDDDVRRAASAAGHPEIEIVEGPLADGDRAALYRACDVLVHPHRAASSPVALAEAMACGLPAIVLDGGWQHEVSDIHTGWLVACSRRPVHPADAAVLAATGPLWQLEPDRQSLAGALRTALGDPDARLRKGLMARDRVVSWYSCDHAADAAARRLTALAQTPRRRRRAPSSVSSGRPVAPDPCDEDGRVQAHARSSR